MNRGGHTNAGRSHATFTNDERALYGSVANLTNIHSTAEAFGVSEDALKNWKLGRTQRVHGPNNDNLELRGTIEERMGIARDQALDKLMETMGYMTPNKLQSCTATQQSTIASNLGTVIGKTMIPSLNISGSNVVIYAPQQRKIKDFDIQDT
jgi:hypothetical protein